ncbi:MAG: DUF2147 domain-containing protein [Hyphomicrobium sp.]
MAGLLAAALASGGAAAAGPREAGVWIDDTGKGAVKIEACGTKLCGRIVWLKEPLNAEGQPLTDKNNPDPAKQSRPICGLPTLGQLEQLPEGGYDGGWVYDPKVGKSYDVAITLTGPNQLQVTGYKGVKFLSKSFMWTRANTDLPPCDAQQAAADPADGVKKPAPAKAASELPWATKSTPAAGAKPAAKPTNAATKPVQQPAAVKRPEGAAQLGSTKQKPAPTSE